MLSRQHRQFLKKQTTGLQKPVVIKLPLLLLLFVDFIYKVKFPNKTHGLIRTEKLKQILKLMDK